MVPCREGMGDPKLQAPDLYFCGNYKISYRLLDREKVVGPREQGRGWGGEGQWLKWKAALV